jgi:competence protein ComEA
MRRVRGQVFWWLAGVVLVALAGVRLLGGGTEPQAAAPVRVVGERQAAEATRNAPSGGATSTGLYVHVAGRVRRPGLYRLGDGARVAAGIDRAGGPARGADLAKVNLAARLEDGQQILVPRIGAARVGAGQASAAGGGSAGAAGAAGAKLSLASATAEQLDGLDGIGPTLAKRILQYRDAHGGFRSVGQLRDVEGIGAKRFEALSKAVGP